jgi:hypothetical protein
LSFVTTEYSALNAVLVPQEAVPVTVIGAELTMNFTIYSDYCAKIF